jgi:hypothetical protein
VHEESPAAAVSRRFGALLLIAAVGVLSLVAAVPRNATHAAGPDGAVRANQGADVGADFNGDGFADLAVGVPGESVPVGDRDIAAAGAVHVIYGSKTGLNGETPLDDEIWHQNRFGGFVAPERGDSFGYALAAADFNYDGFDDLAIGVPGEDVRYQRKILEDAGEVDLLRGSPTGLVGANVALHQGTPPVFSVPQKGDYFGFSLAAGDLGSLFYEDLVIGVPGEDWTDPYGGRGYRTKDAGAVQVLFGKGGHEKPPPREQWEHYFFPQPSQYWTQEMGADVYSSRVVRHRLRADRAEPSDQFGFSVLVADLGWGKEGDLVVGVPYEDVGEMTDAGAVHVIYARKTAYASIPEPVVERSQFWHQTNRIPGNGGKLERGDHFGWALAAADFGRGPKKCDLAVGVPDEDLGNHPGAGAVNVVYGSGAGITVRRPQFWHQGSAGIRGRPETFDHFGYALTAGDFGFGLPADLVVGVPQEDIERLGEDAEAAGAVNILIGTRDGLSARKNWTESQANAGFDGAVEGDSETADWFGQSLAAGNFGLGPGTDLAVGVPGEGKESLIPPSVKQKVGAVNVLYSYPDGLSAINDQFWWQANDSLHGKAEETDEFGRALASRGPRTSASSLGRCP